MQSTLQTFSLQQRKLAHLAHIQALLQRDQEAHMPAKAGPGRSEQISLIATMQHQQSLDPEYIKAVVSLYDQQTEYDVLTQRSIQLAKKDLDYARALPESFVKSFEHLKSQAQQVWAKARMENDFASFAPYLEQIIDQSKRYAAYIQPDKDPYDCLLDCYEEGATKEFYDTVLLPLQQPITKILQSQQAQENVLDLQLKEYPQAGLEGLLKELCTTIGFDFGSGTFGVVHHPFMTTVGAYDYRINTRYDTPLEAITGMVHELGHGLYEQRNDPKLHYSNLHYGASTGMHESQSRTLENFIGRSQEFCQYLHTLFEKHFGSQNRTADQLYKTLNNVRPSLIRIESDEVSYNLHILLRYQIEKELFDGMIKVKDLPARWNNLMKEYLGIVPPNDTNGCLQDVHWSCGYFGYFPTYMLGNLYGAQFFDVCTSEHPDLMQNVAIGDFGNYFNRHKEHIRSKGRSLAPQQLLQDVTGNALSSNFFMHYLEQKFPSNSGQIR